MIKFTPPLQHLHLSHSLSTIWKLGILSPIGSITWNKISLTAPWCPGDFVFFLNLLNSLIWLWLDLDYQSLEFKEVGENLIIILFPQSSPSVSLSIFEICSRLKVFNSGNLAKSNKTFLYFNYCQLKLNEYPSNGWLKSFYLNLLLRKFFIESFHWFDIKIASVTDTFIILVSHCPDRPELTTTASPAHSTLLKLEHKQCKVLNRL